jgi:hypothetical protein
VLAGRETTVHQAGAGLFRSYAEEDTRADDAETAADDAAVMRAP